MLPSQDVLTVLEDICLQREENQSLDTLAQRSGWSRFHFHRGFKKTVGETPKQYVQRLRLERAAVLLATGSDSVFAIALAVGFESHEVFVREFRRLFACSPSQYRCKVLERTAAG